jgi:hypothetical protein
MLLVRSRRRRGYTLAQYALVLGLIILVVFASIKFLGQESNTRLETTSGSVGDPSQLKNMLK